MAHKKFKSLPKHHFSYSQWSLWLSSPEIYKRRYFDGSQVDYSNRGQTFGKEVADALEAGRDIGDVLTDSAMLLLPKYDVADQPIEVDVKTKYGWLNLIAKPDTFNSVTHEFIEFKTGKGGTNRWTAKKAQDHLQMWFYAVTIWQKFGTILPDAKLAWVETEDTPEGIKPTGHVEVFPVHFSQAGLLDALSRIVKAAHEIEVSWAGHITKPWITTF